MNNFEYLGARIEAYGKSTPEMNKTGNDNIKTSKNYFYLEKAMHKNKTEDLYNCIIWL